MPVYYYLFYKTFARIFSLMGNWADVTEGNSFFIIYAFITLVKNVLVFVNENNDGVAYINIRSFFKHIYYS